LHLRLIKADEKILTLLEKQYAPEFWPVLTNTSPIKSWQQSLPATGDLQQHGVEIKIEALPVGEYNLLASNGNDFNKEKNILGARHFYVSNISYVNTGSNYFVLNRETGQPIATAAVTD